MLLNFLEHIIDRSFAVIPRKDPIFKAIPSICLVAHRGAHDHAQGIIENTLAAFDRAKELGCWGIEFDIHATADQVLVVHHDPNLKRLWGSNKAIANLRYNELKTLAPEIPSLKEVVTRYSQSMHLFIELKIPLKDESLLSQDLNELTPMKQYHLLTLDVSFFDSLSQFPKEALLLVAQHNNVNEFCNLSINKHYGGVLGHYLLITNKTIIRLKSAEQIVGVGMVNSKYSLFREINRGIKLIFTNHASKVQLHLQQLNKSYSNK